MEESVAIILKECGLTVAKKKKVNTVRSVVEIDVYAEELIQGRRNLILCECKHWKKAISQEKIHAFRTVMSDVGANSGYMISSLGFQKGAFDAARNTNLELVNYNEFQSKFKDLWLKVYYRKQIENEFGGFLNIAEPAYFYMVVQHIENEEDVKNYHSLINDHHNIYAVLLSFATLTLFSYDPSRFLLPLVKYRSSDELIGIPSNIINIEGYREFFEACKIFIAPIKKQLIELIKKNKNE